MKVESKYGVSTIRPRANRQFMIAWPVNVWQCYFNYQLDFLLKICGLYIYRFWWWFIL